MGSLTPSGLTINQSNLRARQGGRVVYLTSGSGAPEDIANTSFSVEREKFTADATASGNLQHIVARAMGIHTSISSREAVSGPRTVAESGLVGGDALGPMQTITERKVFFLDSDTDKTSGFADWQIFDGSGCPVGTQNGITDTDVAPGATFDQTC